LFPVVFLALNAIPFIITFLHYTITLQFIVKVAKSTILVSIFWYIIITICDLLEKFHCN